MELISNVSEAGAPRTSIYLPQKSQGLHGSWPEFTFTSDGAALKSLSFPGNYLKWKVPNTFRELLDSLQAEALTGCHLFIFHLHASHAAEWSLVLLYTKASLNHFSIKIW